MNGWAIAAGIAGLLAAGGFLAGNGLYSMALDPARDKTKALSTLPKHRQSLAEQEAFFHTVAPQSVYITAGDGLRLHGLECRQPGHDWALILHGYTSEAKYMGSVAQHFYEKGMSVLLPDARGHGQSQGNYIGMGWDERKDILRWLDSIAQRDPLSRILLYGVSMGAATVMMTLGEPLPPQVKGAVEDCGYSSAWEEFRSQIRRLYPLPCWAITPLLCFADLVTKLRAGYFFSDASSVRQLRKCKTPLLCIHGTEDQYVPFFMLEDVYQAAATADKQKLAIPGAQHGASAFTAPALYWDTVDRFAGRVLA